MGAVQAIKAIVGAKPSVADLERELAETVAKWKAAETAYADGTGAWAAVEAAERARNQTAVRLTVARQAEERRAKLDAEAARAKRVALLAQLVAKANVETEITTLAGEIADLIIRAEALRVRASDIADGGGQARREAIELARELGVKAPEMPTAWHDDVQIAHVIRGAIGKRLASAGVAAQRAFGMDHVLAGGSYMEHVKR